MQRPLPAEMLERIRTIPGIEPLLTRLAGRDDVHLVGGAVRDLLLGEHPLDLDLVVEGDAGGLAREWGQPRAHESFGTATVDVEGRPVDLAMARRERYPRPGALPLVEPATLREDLLRRDFTVNAIAVPLSGPRAGELIAAPHALEDLEAHRLRILHDASFSDDPTRLLRLARYAARMGFAVEPRTRKLVDAAAATDALSTVSGARIGAELRLLAREQDPVAGFARLAELGLDEAIAPAFGIDDGGVAAGALRLLPSDGRPDLVVLGLAARKVPRLPELLERIAFEAPDRRIICEVAGAVDLATVLERAGSPARIAAVIGDRGVEAVAAAGALAAASGAPRAAVAARDWLERLRDVGLDIDGRDLLAAGVSPGPEIGRGLRAALAAKLDGRASGREAELEVALRAARG